MKLIENQNNIYEISQQILEKQLTQLNASEIALECGTNPETVTQILTKIRDETMDCIHSNKSNVELNFGIGILSLMKSNQIEFKPVVGIALVPAEDKIQEIAVFEEQ